jgi:hypothetical protein
MSTGPEREENPRLQRVRFELRSDGLKPEQTRTNPLRSGDHSRGYLPHVKREGASYFVTFRLADSLPREVLMKFEGERAQALRVAAARSGGAVPEAERLEIERELRRKVERYLDQGAGECHLRRPEVADLVGGAMRYFDGERYVLREWVVMPNHVHVVVWPMPNPLLSDILKSWKRFTSREANKLLGRTGETFWQRDVLANGVVRPLGPR